MPAFRWTALMSAVLAAWSAAAQPSPPLTVRSRSGQFVVYGGAAWGAAPPAVHSAAAGQGRFFRLQPKPSGTNENTHIRLHPSLTAVSCERFREAFRRELEINDSGGGQIHVRIHPELRMEDVRIGMAPSIRGWLYSVELPAEMDSQRFAAAILQVLMVEQANRNSPGTQTEPPMWLSAGMIRQVLAAHPDILPPEPDRPASREQVRRDPLSVLRERFQNETPLSFEELSWPETLPPHRAALFQDSAHFFLAELLRLKDGRACLRGFFDGLRAHKNWQFAFLEAFRPHFERLVDVEKWWALKYAALSGRDVSRLWTAEESWLRLKTALDVPVKIHLRADRLPSSGVLSLQEIIRDWDISRQTPVLARAVEQLGALRTHVHPDYLSLAEEYHRTLRGYLEQRRRGGREDRKNETGFSPAVLKKTTVRQLDALDERRSQLRPGTNATPPGGVRPQTAAPDGAPSARHGKSGRKPRPSGPLRP